MDKNMVQTACDCLDCDPNIKELELFISSRKGQSQFKSNLIAVLHKAQGLYGWLSHDTIRFISSRMSIPTAHIWGVATFYHYFNLKPVGRYVISICMGTACFVKGANEILDELKTLLKISTGETTSDGLFTLYEARCLGACGLAPVMMVNDTIYGNLDRKRIRTILNELRKSSEKSPKTVQTKNQYQGAVK